MSYFSCFLFLFLCPAFPWWVNLWVSCFSLLFFLLFLGVLFIFSWVSCLSSVYLPVYLWVSCLSSCLSSVYLPVYLWVSCLSSCLSSVYLPVYLWVSCLSVYLWVSCLSFLLILLIYVLLISPAFLLFWEVKFMGVLFFSCFSFFLFPFPISLSCFSLVGKFMGVLLIFYGCPAYLPAYLFLLISLRYFFRANNP